MTQPKNSIRKKGRNVSGIVLVDKPKGMSSNGALQVVKRLFSARKAGHSGSLDPLASGMLPVLLGEATKFSQFLLDADKSYYVVGELGVKTTTGDAEGEIVSQCVPEKISSSALEKVLEKFRGVITQIPSMYSALKHQGQPLYKLARQGIEVERKPRNVNIDELNLLDYDGATITLQVKCSKGTYIRTLIEDIGEVLKCGAHVQTLRRTDVGPYLESQMITLDALHEMFEQGGLAAIDAQLLPVDTAIQDWPLIELSPVTSFYLQQGQSVLIPHAPTSGWVRLRLKSGDFIGVGEVLEDGRIAPRRLVTSP